MIAALSDRDQLLLRLAADTGQITARETSEQLYLSRAVAGQALRALERTGHLDGQLVGGGEIGYRPTALGRKRLGEITSAPVAKP